MLNIISRHIWLIDLIANRQGITFPEINEEWQRSSVNPTGDSLPVRTFCNWKKDILDEFGIKLLCNRRTNGYSIDRIDDIKDGSIREWMLNAFTVSNLLSERDALEGRILLENVPSGQVCLKHFVAAMKGNRRVRFQYSKFVSGDTQEVILEPYCVKLYERRWYVVGRNVEKDSLEPTPLIACQGLICWTTVTKCQNPLMRRNTTPTSSASYTMIVSNPNLFACVSKRPNGTISALSHSTLTKRSAHRR